MRFYVDEACDITEGYGTWECHLFRRRIFSAHESLCIHLANHYVRTAKKYGYRKANLELGKFHSQLTLGSKFTGIFIDSSHDEITRFSKMKAERVDMFYRYQTKSHSLVSAVAFIAEYLSKHNLKLPLKSENPTEEELLSAIARVIDYKWWVREIKKKQDNALEAVQIQVGQVNKNRGIYASEQCVIRKLRDWRRNELILKSLIAENDLGQTYNLYDLAMKSVSNLVNRRNDLMVRIAGFEQHAKNLQHKALFITITAPSRYHAYHSNPCRPNSKYEGFTPSQTNQYFNTVWKRIRSRLHRCNIKPYGFRVVEPHHDGTPHWHLLFFVDKEHQEELVNVIKEYSLRESPNESGAQERRVTFEYIDPEKGSAAGYIAKYIAKNIDGEHVGADLYGRDAIESAIRIRAWASNWNIRQFEQIGGPSVTTYRELRRLRDNSAFDVDPTLKESGQLEQFRSAADEGDWSTFTELSGGAQCPRSEQPLRAYHVVKEQLNKYGEVIQKLKGILYFGYAIVTRLREWVIRPIDCSTNFETEEGLPIGGANAPPLEYCQ